MEVTPLSPLIRGVTPPQLGESQSLSIAAGNNRSGDASPHPVKNRCVFVRIYSLTRICHIEYIRQRRPLCSKLSVGSGPFTSMLSNATSIAWNRQPSRKGRRRRRGRAQTANLKKEKRNENQSDQPIRR